MIALIDYGAGNLTSVKKALAAIRAEWFVPTSPADLAPAAGVIVPGVGHFGATRVLDTPWMEAIVRCVGDGRPLLGICLGMQWLFEGSDEAPDVPGLGVLSGQCYRLGTVRLTASAEATAVKQPDQTIKVPHVGWNSLAIVHGASIVDGVPPDSQVYFTHSYVAPLTSDTVATSEHGESFAAIVQHGRIAGVQFHPEKSGEVGLTILRNFVALAG
jgi:glutamine amidotransferase